MLALVGQASAQRHLLCGVKGMAAATQEFLLNKSTEIVYVLMGEHTQITDITGTVRQSDSASVLRPIGRAPRHARPRHILAGSGGVVDDVAAFG
jgi:hypothetical protein